MDSTYNLIPGKWYRIAVRGPKSPDWFQLDDAVMPIGVARAKFDLGEVIIVHKRNPKTQDWELWVMRRRKPEKPSAFFYGSPQEAERAMNRMLRWARSARG